MRRFTVSRGGMSVAMLASRLAYFRKENSPTGNRQNTDGSDQHRLLVFLQLLNRSCHRLHPLHVAHRPQEGFSLRAGPKILLPLSPATHHQTVRPVLVRPSHLM